MSSFLVHFVIFDQASADEKAMQATLEQAGFLGTVAGGNHLYYRLPKDVYQCTTVLTAEQVLDRLKRIALRTRKRSQIVVTESTASTWVGLELVGRESSLIAAGKLLPCVATSRASPPRRSAQVA